MQGLHAGLSVCARLLLPPAAPVHPHRRCFLTKRIFDTVETTNRRRHRAQQARVAAAGRCDGLNEDFIWKFGKPRHGLSGRGAEDQDFRHTADGTQGCPLPCTWGGEAAAHHVLRLARQECLRNRAPLLFQARPHGRRHGSKLSIDPFPHGTRGARLNPMNARVDHLLDEVLGLPVEERSALAVALLDSLETADEATISELWRAEVNRRRAELRAGRVQAAPWAEARQRLSSL